MKSPVKMPPAWIYFLAQKIFAVLGWMLLKQDVRGRENLPAHGAYLLAFNHLSMVDAPLLLIHVRRQMVGMMTDKYAESPFIGWLANLLGALWVTRGEADMDAIKACLGHLRAGGILAISPEGTRSPSGQLLKGKTGVAYLATRTGVPIVPVGIAGTEKVFANVRRLRRTPVTFIIGQPFTLPADSRAKGEKLEEYTERLMHQIAALVPPEYRGVYADAVNRPLMNFDNQNR
jgi:1-acyl-sn-glycerol-3-phosphate acyltransferase